MSKFDVVVLGSGPGGYTAAFRAADLGLKTALVERHDSLGGVCLNVGCIPSKTLLHIAEVIAHAGEMKASGVVFDKPRIDIAKIRAKKEAVVKKLTGGLAMLARQRKVQIIRGTGKFVGADNIMVSHQGKSRTVQFKHAIIAAGSQAVKIAGFPDSARIMDSTAALELSNVPKKLLVVGGGIVGLEMATVYNALGSEITVVEHGDSLIHGADQDVVNPLFRKLKQEFNAIHLNCRVSELKSESDGLSAVFTGDNAPPAQKYDRALLAVGRTPNGKLIGAENAGVEIDERGFIPVNRSMRTNISNIFAIGDIVGQPMLAHKAVHEGKVAAEVIAGKKSEFDPLTIPSVAYTNPEVAWCGLTETEAKNQGIEYTKGVFPWAASGRNLSIGRNDGMTKLMFAKDDGRLIGAGIVGVNAGELIAEAALALEMGADAEDIGLTIHPHPTLAETLSFAAEMASGTITDLLPQKEIK